MSFGPVQSVFCRGWLVGANPMTPQSGGATTVQHERCAVAVGERLDLPVVDAQAGVDAVDGSQRCIDCEETAVSRRHGLQRRRGGRHRLPARDRGPVIGNHLTSEPARVDDRDVQELSVRTGLGVETAPLHERREPISREQGSFDVGIRLGREIADAHSHAHHPAGIVDVAWPRQHGCGRIESVRGQRSLGRARPREAAGFRLLGAGAERSLHGRLDRHRPRR